MAEERRIGGMYVTPAIEMPVLYKFLVILLVVLMTGIAFSSAGCGSSTAVRNYVDQTKEILNDITASLVELKEYWVLPLEDQGNLKEELEGYNEAVEKGQALLDHVDSPAECRDLEDLMTYIVEKAKSIGTITTQFGDYAENMSESATDVSNLVAELEVHMTKKDLPTGARKMFETANSINATVHSNVPPPLFQGIQEEFNNFVTEMTEQFREASEKASHWRMDESDYPEEDEEGEEDEPQDNYRNKALTPILEDIPGQWAEFNAEMAQWMEAARELSGLNAAYAEFDELIIQAQGEIDAIEKKYL